MCTILYYKIINHSFTMTIRTRRNNPLLLFAIEGHQHRAIVFRGGGGRWIMFCYVGDALFVEYLFFGMDYFGIYFWDKCKENCSEPLNHSIFDELMFGNLIAVFLQLLNQ